MLNFMTEEPDISIPADEKTLIHAFGFSPMEAGFVQAMLNTTAGWGRTSYPKSSTAFGK